MIRHHKRETTWLSETQAGWYEDGDSWHLFLWQGEAQASKLTWIRAGKKADALRYPQMHRGQLPNSLRLLIGLARP